MPELAQSAVQNAQQHPQPGRWRFAALGALVFIVVAVYGWQLGAPFELQDDHRIVRFSGQLPFGNQVPGADRGVFADYVAAVEEDMRDVGRFRPVGWALDVVVARVLGAEPGIWRILELAQAAAASALFYLVGMRSFRRRSAALIFALVIMLSPDPGAATVWFRLGVRSEAVGSILIGLAFLLMRADGERSAAARDWLSLLLVGVASLAKEPFVLLIPAMALLRVWIEARTSGMGFFAVAKLRSNLLLGYGVVFAALMCTVLWIALGAATTSYGGRSLHPESSELVFGVGRSLALMPRLCVWFIPPGAALIVFAFRARRSGGWSSLLVPAAIFAAWMAPQIGLYATRGGMWDHYWMPSVIALAGLNAASFCYLLDSRAPYLRAIAVAATLAWVINAVRIEIPSLVSYKHRASAQQALVNSVAQRIQAGGRVVVVADMATQSELSYAVLYFISLQRNAAVKAYLYDVQSAGPPQGLAKRRFALAPYYQEAPDLDSVSPACIQAVVFLSPPAASDRAWNAWFNRGKFERKDVPWRQISASIGQMQLVSMEHSLGYAYRSKPPLVQASCKD